MRSEILAANEVASATRRHPLLVNAYALILNAVFGAIFGIGFWIAAARNYSPADVGRASAAISCLLLVSSIGQLNLSAALPRFLPSAGHGSRKLVLGSYFAAVTATGVTASVFLLVAANNDGLTDAVGPGVRHALWFWAASIAWVLFTLQDSALAGLRKTGSVIADNAIYGAVRFAALVALSSVWTRGGMFAAWTFPLVGMIVAVNWLLFRRYLPRHAEATCHQTPATIEEIKRYASSDYAGSLVTVSLAYLVPAVVVAAAGASVGGRVAICWAVASSLDVASTSFATSLTVEGAHDNDTGRLREMALAITGRLALLISSAVLLIVIAAPFVLGALGPAYSEDVTFLRLLGLGALGRIVVAPWFAIARVRHETRKIALIELTRGLTVLIVSVVLSHRLGVEGLGVGVVAGQAVAAFLAWPELRDVLWPEHRKA
ncbi:MAG: lipopolysaccharide biosynthesis protein [Acidimicrobiia bacterium]